ncbi:MAG: LysR family transcriptional regulator [Desulfobacterales bacterium]|nr:LysR family transcriptional regulator [Desulfobacterales bacterium]
MKTNWDDIRYFLALCRTRSFVAAGSELKVTHSTVSRRLSALEGSLQTQLFFRSEKGCRLTPAGEKLLPYAERLESTIALLDEEVSGRDKQLSGSIRIGAPDGFGNCFLAPRLAQFQRLHPTLEVELVAVPMYYSLAKREIDILITVRKPAGGHIIAKKLPSYRFGLFATKKYLKGHAPIRSPEDLRRHRMIGYIEDLLYDEELNFINEIVTGLRPRFRSSTIIGQMNAILADSGIGIIPYFMAHSAGTLVSVLPELGIDRTFWIQFNPDSRRIARVRATIDFIVAEMESSTSVLARLPHARRRAAPSLTDPGPEGADANAARKGRKKREKS